MKNILGKLGKGAYLLVCAAILGIISMMWFVLWASRHDGMDGLIVAMLLLGVALDLILLVRDNEFLIIISVGCYSIAVVRLLTNSVGSFVDAYQGVKMFGDSSQVTTIVKMSVIMGISVLISIIAAFLNRRKE